MDGKYIEMAQELLYAYANEFKETHDNMGVQEQRLEPVDAETTINLNKRIKDSFSTQCDLYRYAMANSYTEAINLEKVADCFADADANMIIEC